MTKNITDVYRTLAFLFQVAVYFMMQSIIIPVTHSKLFPTDQLQGSTLHVVRTALPEERTLEGHKNTSKTESSQGETAEDGQRKFLYVLKRLTRSANHCVKSRTQRYNKCLGKYISVPKCKTLSVACLSATNVAAKCKRKYTVVNGINGRRCLIKDCSCAA